jgi:hypothetical protein
MYKAQLLGQHSPPEGADDPNKFEVDFLGIAQCYLGSDIFSGGDKFDMELTCKMMVNFYNYFLLHNICPEYTGQIRAARDLASTAPIDDLPKKKRASLKLPGTFNRACGFLFGGYESELNPVIMEKPVDGEGEDAYYDTERAKLHILYATLALGTDALVKTIQENKETWHENVRCVKTLKTGLKIIALTPATKAVNDLYAATNNPKFQPHPIGIITCQHWSPDLFTYYDLPKGCQPADAYLPSEVTFWIEDSVQQDLEIGMKIEGTVSLLDFGNGEQIWILDRVGTLYSPFYRPTLNELMVPGKAKTVRWKVPIPEYMKAQWTKEEYARAMANIDLNLYNEHNQKASVTEALTVE